MPWSVVIPVKVLDEAKSRLLPPDDPARAELALAFVSDCLRAVSQSRRVERIRVVCDDERVHREAQQLGAEWVPEAPARGLNEAAAVGLMGIEGPAAIVAGDLPCLTSAALDLVLDLAAAHDRSFISDAQGTGTTMLMCSDAAQSTPMFGERSRARHRAAGYADLGLDATAGQRTLLARARRDVDTSVDLADAIRIGVGPATQRVVHWHTAP